MVTPEALDLGSCAGVVIVLPVGWILDDRCCSDPVDKRSSWRGPCICGFRNSCLLRLLLAAAELEFTQIDRRNQKAVGRGLLRPNGVILLGRGEP